MAEKKYILRYLPLFYEDLDSKITYISEKLRNPQAAHDLLNAVEQSILERLPAAESFEKFVTGKKIMEVRRLLYNGQDADRVI